MSNPMVPPQPQVEVDLDAYVQTLIAQRNQAMDAVAQLQGVISRQGKKIADLEAQLPSKPNGDGRGEVRVQ